MHSWKTENIHDDNYNVSYKVSGARYTWIYPQRHSNERSFNSALEVR